MVLHETDLTVLTMHSPVILNLIYIICTKLHILKMINNGIFPEVSGKVLITYWEQHCAVVFGLGWTKTGTEELKLMQIGFVVNSRQIFFQSFSGGGSKYLPSLIS